MSRNNFSSLKKPSEHWHGGLSTFLGELEARSFQPELYVNGSKVDVVSLHSNKEVALLWSALKAPCALENVWAASDYAYFSKVPAKKIVSARKGQSLGLAFVEKANFDSISESFKESGAKVSLVLACRNADAAMDVLLRSLHAGVWTFSGSPKSVWSSLPASVVCEAGVLVGPDCEIGEGCVFESGVRIGSRVKIGKNVRLGAGTTILDDCEIGDECHIGAHCAVGGQGFGFVLYPGESHRRPRLHVGRVVLGSHIRMGSFCSVDRGVIGDTQIGSYSSLDNFVQVAHNCVLGERGVYCGFVGISGSTTVGDDVTMAGMVGTKGHVSIGNRVTIAAQSGVSRDIANDEVVKGYPPLPLKETLKIQALLGRLPEFFDRLRKLEKSKT